MSRAAIKYRCAKHQNGCGAPPRGAPLDVLEMAVAAAFAIPSAELWAPTRRSATSALARQTAMYLAHVAFGLSFTEVGEIFGRDRSTAAHACRRTESRRDDPHMDILLAGLEHACGALILAPNEVR